MEVNESDLNSSSSPEIGAAVSERAGTTGQAMANQYMANAPIARGLLNQPDNFNSGLSYGDHATSEAIKSRYVQEYNRGEKQLKLDVMKSAQADHLKHLNVASQAAGQEVEMNKQKALLKWKIDQANKKARGAVVGNVLGIVGGVVGGIYGGPAGAGAGYALGSGVGNAVGSS